jgi:predicted Rossmann fold flavoprotein
MAAEERWDAIVVGAGAAGVFAALRARECSPGLRLLLLEGSARPLRKVSISGGGRCNVTHACRDLDWLLSCYPRGGPRLEAILGRFMPEDTVRWFEQRGVKLKTEADGRMFPVTDLSQTIVDVLLGAARRGSIELRTETRVEGLKARPEGRFELRCGSTRLLAARVLLATGGGSRATGWLRELGHEVVPDIPSLFTFDIAHPVIAGLQGLSVARARLRLLTDPPCEAEGPLLVTHWGLSGPAVLKLSAFGARALAALRYRAELLCDLLPDLGREEVWQTLSRGGEARVVTASPFSSLPKRLWQRLVAQAQIADTVSWRRLPAARVDALVGVLKALKLPISGKGVFKDEFVTAGGLPLHEVDPYTMQSRKVPGLFVAGELLDVDGITGGFNFQNAWATGYIAGEGLAGEG